MKLPTWSHPRAAVNENGRPLSETGAARAETASRGVTPAGCCALVCVPLAGCHCVLESPLC